MSNSPSPEPTAQALEMENYIYREVGRAHSIWSMVETSLRTLYESFFDGDRTVAHVAYNAINGFEIRHSVVNAVVLAGLQKLKASQEVGNSWCKISADIKKEAKRRGRIAHFSVVYTFDGKKLVNPKLVSGISNRPLKDAINGHLNLGDIQKMSQDWMELAQTIMLFGSQQPLTAWPSPTSVAREPKRSETALNPEDHTDNDNQPPPESRHQ